jgi:hypothetical protein
VFKANFVFPAAAILTVFLAGLLPWLEAQAPQLPPGAIAQKVTTSCTECHESRIISQQRLSKPAWGKEVDKMIRWGAVVDSADRDPFIDYLSTNFPADEAPEVMPRAVAPKSH